MSNIVNKAMEYVNKGIGVHLLIPFEKRPINNGWSKAPVLKSNELYEEFKATPDANIGVRLGDYSIIKGLYLYVIDLDISSNEPSKIQTAYNELEKIFKDYDKLPCVKSASKNSRHFYFLSKHVIKTKKLAHSATKINVMVNGEEKLKNDWEIDICGTGKQVVLPPSVFNNNTYAWDRDLLEYIEDDAKFSLIIINDLSLLNLGIEEEKLSFGKKIKGDTPINLDSESISINKIKAILDRLPSEFIDNYDDWLKVGMALHNEFYDTENEQEAIQLYDEFSKKSEKYTKGDAFKKWRSFVKSDDGITIGTLIAALPKLATEDKITMFGKFLNEEKVNFDTLKEQLRVFKFKSYEVEQFMSSIALKLSTENTKYNITSARKLIMALEKEIREEHAEKLEKLAIGLDDTLGNMVLKQAFNDGKYLINQNGLLFHYNNGYWQRFDIQMLEKITLEEIKNIINSKSEEYDTIKETIFLKKKNDDLNGLTNQIVNIILKMTAVNDHDDVLNLKNTKEVNYSIINTLNKEIYIYKNGKIETQDHSFDSYLITRFNVNYNPEATCPNWMRMLNNVFQKYHDKDEVIRHFSEIVAYILQTQKPDPVFVLNFGNGDNGKSFVWSEICKVLGVNSVLSKNVHEFAQDKHATTALLGKNLLMDDDWQKGQILPDGLIKKISENKLITTRPMYKEEFSFISKSTVVINSNNSVKTKDVSNGMQRRAHVFEFNYKFEKHEKEKDLSEKLALERDGFLNYLIGCYVNYLKRGFFKIPLSTQKSINNWLKNSNPLMAFLSEKVIKTNDIEDKVKAHALFEMYKNFIINENSSFNMSRNNFYDDLRNIDGIKIITNKSDKTIYIHGLKSK